MSNTDRGRPFRLLVALPLSACAIALLAACGSGRNAAVGRRGFLTGEIFIIGVPTPPDGPPSPAGIVMIFSPGYPSASEKVVARVHLPVGGRFRIQVPAGSYMVAAEVKNRSSCAPTTTSVAPGMTSSSEVLVGCGKKVVFLDLHEEISGTPPPAAEP